MNLTHNQNHLSTNFRFFITLFLLINISDLSAADILLNELDSLPSVFMIGENEAEYEVLVSTCNDPLLSVCNDSMDEAYKKWLGLLSDMEKYAESKDFDIRGIKIWLNVFWNTDGSIKHLVYYPKPNSRNMDFELLSDFLVTFQSEYNMDFTNQKCFSHYGSAAFPTFADIYLGKEK